MTVYFIADTHFSDDDIRRYENRPFADVTQMNETLVANWNHTVKNTDTVYILGDFGDISYLSRLQGTKYLVKGNHDALPNTFYRENGFTEVYDLPVIFNEYWLLSHAPLYVNRNMPYANIFGHVHNTPAYNTISSRSYCVSVERINYTPISLQEIKSAILQAQQTEKEAAF